MWKDCKVNSQISLSSAAFFHGKNLTAHYYYFSLPYFFFLPLYSQNLDLPELFTLTVSIPEIYWKKTTKCVCWFHLQIYNVNWHQIFHYSECFFSVILAFTFLKIQSPILSSILKSLHAPPLSPPMFDDSIV